MEYMFWQDNNIKWQICNLGCHGHCIMKVHILYQHKFGGDLIRQLVEVVYITLLISSIQWYSTGNKVLVTCRIVIGCGIYYYETSKPDFKKSVYS